VISSNLTKPLRIAQVSSLWVSVPPKTYGGIERRVFHLAEELVKRGHDVALFATADSKTHAKLKSVYKYGLTEAMDKGEAYSYEYYINSSIQEVLQCSQSFDVIHFHLGCSAIPLSVLSKAPVLHTIPTAITIDDIWVINRYPDVPIIALSEQQLEPLPLELRKNIKVIYNGCDFDNYRLSENPGKYLAFLGRMGPHKSPLNAIRIAKKLQLPIVLAGAPLTNPEKIYFEKDILPLIDGNEVKYIGSVNDDQKNGLFSQAMALLFPIQWEEPFGNVMIEAMACGVPVIALNKGSVREVIDYGITGFYSDFLDDLLPLVSRAIKLNRRVIREHAMSRFSHKKMVDEYIKVYESIIENANSKC
jgi:glycosyltransferase involved in cell wall biosynthesis